MDNDNHPDHDSDSDDADYVPDEQQSKTTKSASGKRARPTALTLDPDDELDDDELNENDNDNDNDDDDDDDNDDDHNNNKDADVDTFANDDKDKDNDKDHHPHHQAHSVPSSCKPAEAHSALPTMSDPLVTSSTSLAAASPGSVVGTHTPSSKRKRTVSPSASVDMDALWAEMSAGSTYIRPGGYSSPSASDATLSAWLSAPGPKRSSSGLPAMPRLADLEAAAAAATRAAENAAPRRAGRTGLEKVLGGLRGTKPASVMTGSRMAWDSFKGADDLVKDELDVYKKDRTRYTDRVAFLARSDVREWEFEQRGKKSRR